MNQRVQPARVATGIEGFDAFTGGGFPAGRLYLLEGDPGVGKTTFAFQFLREGVKLGEKVLLISLAETRDELMDVAASHDWTLDGIDIFQLSAVDVTNDNQYTVLEPSEIELSDTMQLIFEEVERVKPSRVVFDSLSEMRLLAESPLRYRRQIVSMKRHFAGRNCTVMLLDDRGGDHKDLTLQSLVHGVVELQKFSPVYGKARRKVQVVKMRGVNFNAGFHDFNITRGGIEVYPRLVAAEHVVPFAPEQCRSHSAGLDEILGGGLDRGTTTLIMGPAGCGKSSLSVLYAVTAAERGEKAVIFLFDEGIATLRGRARQLNMSLDPHLETGLIELHQIDPAEMSPGEFMWHVKRVVENGGARFIAIDSLTGYLDAMPESQFLTIQMHEMLTYLNHRGVLSMLTMAQHGYMGPDMQSPADVSYLADTVILLRFFEAQGTVQKAISIVKKRSGRHQTTIREYVLGPDRITVGHELKEFHGIMTGYPTIEHKTQGEIERGDATHRR